MRFRVLSNIFDVECEVEYVSVCRGGCRAVGMYFGGFPLQIDGWKDKVAACQNRIDETHGAG